MRWNHRVLRNELEDGSEIFSIIEVYYDDDGEPYGWAEVTLQEDSLNDMLWLIDKLLGAMDMPTLESSDISGEDGSIEDPS